MKYFAACLLCLLALSMIGCSGVVSANSELDKSLEQSLKIAKATQIEMEQDVPEPEVVTETETVFENPPATTEGSVAEEPATQTQSEPEFVSGSQPFDILMVVKDNCSDCEMWKHAKFMFDGEASPMTNLEQLERKGWKIGWRPDCNFRYVDAEVAGRLFPDLKMPSSDTIWAPRWIYRVNGEFVRASDPLLGVKFTMNHLRQLMDRPMAMTQTAQPQMQQQVWYTPSNGYMQTSSGCNNPDCRCGPNCTCAAYALQTQQYQMHAMRSRHTSYMRPMNFSYRTSGCVNCR